MSLEQIAKEIEKQAIQNKAEIFIDYSAKENSFIPVINEHGTVGAVGQYLENDRIKTGFFLLNDRVVRYALSEGFKKEDIYKFFKKTLFKEIKKDEFFKLMTEKKY